MAQILELLVSPVHRYDGRPSTGLPDGMPDELADRVVLRAGLGIVGDRYFNRSAHRDASVTLMSAEWLAAWPDAGLRQTRRNILLEGVDVDAAVGRTVELDSGDGPVALRLTQRAHPCAWLDVAIAPGAWKALRGHGGLCATPLMDGVLRVGQVDVRWLD